MLLAAIFFLYLVQTAEGSLNELGEDPYVEAGNENIELRSCSIGIDRFELVGFFRVLLAKNYFWLVWLINFLNRTETKGAFFWGYSGYSNSGLGIT